MYLLSKTVFYNIEGKNYINDIPPIILYGAMLLGKM